MSTPDRRRTTRARDREATEQAIVDATLELLADEGFHAIGVNEIARRAGCDKQLIYRYFEGLDGVIERVGVEVGRQFEQSLAEAAPGEPPASYAELVERMLLALAAVFRRNALLRAITAWELAAPAPAVTKLVAARARQLQAWVSRARGTLAPPDGIDAAATNALLIAAVQQLALSAHASGSFAGVPLRSVADWKRVETEIARLVRLAYATPAR